MKRVGVLLFFSVFLLQCNSRTGKEQAGLLSVDDPANWPIEITFENGVKNEREVRLSEIASGVEYIPLETSDNSLVSSLNNNILMTDEYIFTVCRNGLQQFDRKGKFIRKISSTGVGPGEYNIISAIFTDEKERKIYIGSEGTQKVLEYDFDGNFIQEFSTPMLPRFFGRLGDGNFVFVKSPVGFAGDTLAYFTDARGQVYHTLLDPHRTEEKNMGVIQFFNDRVFYTFDNELKYKDFQNDTLFVVKDRELIPRYVISLGKYELPADKSWHALGPDMNLYNSQAKNYFRIGSVIESPSQLLFNYTTWAMSKNAGGLIMYDKKQEQLVKLKDSHFKNDIDEVIPFLPVIYTNGKLVGYFQPDRLMDDEKGNDKWESHPQLKNLEEEDNPVIMVVTLK